MNFLSCCIQSPLPDSPVMREDSIFVDSRGTVTRATRYGFRCAQGKHMVTATGPCARCEKEWWWEQGRISVAAIEGWVNDTLKIANEERHVLLAQGWLIDKITAHFTHLVPPDGEGDLLIPTYDPEDIPREVRKAFSLSTAPELPANEQGIVTRMTRKGLMAYKRVAPTLRTLDEHLSYLAGNTHSPRSRTSMFTEA
ncbi:hypothetical protein J7643_04510 [bacterium]|nr:hypothetical protein [bacterium]